jgi:alkanesulfonate monooxygenase SsuD/methylene tetrahydromethanopterin reductase-like flavin-dependent oxidoreductase (luciferase family)
MRFGLFGGARTVLGGRTSDSLMYTDYVDYVCEAEALGFHGLFLVEHHFTGNGQVSDSLGFLKFLAAKTTTMRLGTAVIVLPWHNPALLAEQVATTDLLSGGRFDFGIGRGYRQNEFDGFCIDIGEAEARYRECLDFLRTAWSAGGRFSHHGTYWHFDEIVVEPEPVQQPHPPIWVGAGSARSIEAAAREGFNTLLSQHGTPAQIGEKIALYRAATEAAGRQYRPGSVGLTRALHVVNSAAERTAAHELRNAFMSNVQELANRGAASGTGFYKGYHDDADMRAATEGEALIGDAREIAGRVRAYEEVGVDYILMLDVSGSRDALRTFGREVLPQFTEHAMPRTEAAQ